MTAALASLGTVALILGLAGTIAYLTAICEDDEQPLVDCIADGLDTPTTWDGGAR